MLRVHKETLFYPLNANTEKIEVLFIYLKPPIFRVTFLKYCLVTGSVSGKAPKQFLRNVKGIIED